MISSRPTHMLSVRESFAASGSVASVMPVVSPVFPCALATSRITSSRMKWGGTVCKSTRMPTSKKVSHRNEDERCILEPLAHLIAADRCLADAKRDHGLPRGKICRSLH